jgi:hypothetical protein
MVMEDNFLNEEWKIIQDFPACDDGHDEVCFEKKNCPVCLIIDQMKDLLSEIKELNLEIKMLNEEKT